MVGADAVDNAVVDRGPEGVAVARLADRRVHLREGAELLVALGCGESEMLRQDLDRGDVLVLGEQRHFFRGRDMQDVDAAAVLVREGEQALGGAHGGFDVAPLGVHGDVGAGGDQGGAFLQAEVVLAVHGDTAVARAQHARDVLVVGDQQRTGG